MHSAVRNGQESMAMILTVTMKIMTQLSSSPKQKRKAKRDKKWLKGNVNVGLQLIYGPPIRSALTIRRG